MMSRKVSVPLRLRLWRGDLAFERAARKRVLQRYREALGADRLDHEIDGTRPHRGDHIVDAAMGGLDDHGNRKPGVAHSCEHAEAVEVRHDEVEHDAIGRGLVAGEHRGESGFAAIDHDGLVARLGRHVLEEPALHRVVIDDKDALGHGTFGETRASCLDSSHLPRLALTGCKI